jgi:exosortase
MLNRHDSLTTNMTQAVTTLNDATTPLSDSLESEPLYYGLTPTAWLKVAVVSILMVATFRFNLVRLWLKTNPFNGEPNWRHAICIPAIGLYYLYVNRDDLLATPVSTAWSGLGILIFGILLFAFAVYPGQNDWLKDLGMAITLFGVVTLLCGWRVMKIAWFPILFLICAFPWPELVYSYIASPLQRLAASVAVGTLRFTGVTALNSGTKIIIVGRDGAHTLNVAEACAGMRSLMTFISVGGAVAFLSNRPLWQKILITLSAIPIAVFCNVMRVTGQGYIDLWKGHEWSEGFAHQFVGIVMLAPGFLMILLTGWVLDKLFIEEVDDNIDERQKKVIKASKPADWAAAMKPIAPALATASPAMSAAVVQAPAKAPPSKSTAPKPAAPKIAPPSGAIPKPVPPKAIPPRVVHAAAPKIGAPVPGTAKIAAPIGQPAPAMKAAPGAPTRQPVAASAPRPAAAASSTVKPVVKPAVPAKPAAPAVAKAATPPANATAANPAKPPVRPATRPPVQRAPLASPVPSKPPQTAEGT